MSSSDASDGGDGRSPIPDPGRARLTLGSATGLVELTLLAADFTTIARGTGTLSLDLDPGVYEVVARAGPATVRRLIRLAPGQVREETGFDVPFPAAAPVEGTSTTLAYQRDLVIEATGLGPAPTAGEAGLVIVVRDPQGYDGPPVTRLDTDRLRLLDDHLQPRPGFVAQWKISEREAVATWAGIVPPGGYVLRVELGPSGPASSGPTGDVVDQSIWLAPGWQTIVFLTRGSQGPRLASASIHMSRLGTAWNPNRGGSAEPLELGLWGLRRDRPALAVAPLTSGVARDATVENPMLGIVLAHSLLLEQRDGARLDELLTDLDRQVPGHPDLIALHALADDGPGVPPGNGSVQRGGRVVPVDGVTWPPMLLASYLALVGRDAAEPGTVSPDTVAERAAANISVHGIWTAWRPLPLVEPASPARQSAEGEGEGGGTVARVLAVLAQDPSRLSGFRRADPAVQRVASYLTAVADLEGPDGRSDRFREMNRSRIALATHLPSAVVERAFRTIGAVVLPPTSPRTANGRQIAWRLLLIAAALLGLALLGSAFILNPPPAASPSPWPTETASPTAEPSPSETASPTASATIKPRGELRFRPPRLDFGPTTRTDEVQRVTVIAIDPVRVGRVWTSGENSSDFVVGRENCQDRELEVNASCSIEVGFAWHEPGRHLASLEVETDGGLFHLPLSGESYQLR